MCKFRLKWFDHSTEHKLWLIKYFRNTSSRWSQDYFSLFFCCLLWKMSMHNVVSRPVPEAGLPPSEDIVDQVGESFFHMVRGFIHLLVGIVIVVVNYVAISDRYVIGTLHAATNQSGIPAFSPVPTCKGRERFFQRGNRTKIMQSWGRSHPFPRIGTS